jgi:hypothetical protein
MSADLDEPLLTVATKLEAAAGVGAAALFGRWPTDAALEHLVATADHAAKRVRQLTSA